MTWSIVTEYLCHIWPRIFSICRSHSPVFLLFSMTYQRTIINKDNTTGGNSGVGNVHTSVAPEGIPDILRGSCYTIVGFLYCVLWFIVCPFSFGYCIVCPSSVFGSGYPLVSSHFLKKEISKYHNFQIHAKTDSSGTGRLTTFQITCTTSIEMTEHQTQKIKAMVAYY